MQQPVHVVAIYLGICEQALAGRLAEHFATIPVAPPDEVIYPRLPEPLLGHHPFRTISQSSALCEEPVLANGLNAALARTKWHSTPSAMVSLTKCYAT